MCCYSGACVAHFDHVGVCSTGPQQLDNGCSAFERGSVAVCEFAAPDVGRVRGVALATDASCRGGRCSLTSRSNTMSFVYVYRSPQWCAGRHASWYMQQSADT